MQFFFHTTKHLTTTSSRQGGAFGTSKDTSFEYLKKSCEYCNVNNTHQAHQLPDTASKRDKAVSMVRLPQAGAVGKEN